MKKEIGLTSAEARESFNQSGDNRIAEQHVEGFWEKYWGNFDDPIIKILCVALLINVVFAVWGQVAWYESVGIFIAVLLATFVSTFSEYRNENAFQALQSEASLIKCRVWRDGAVTELPIDDLVKGDCLMLQTGDKVPVDGFLIEGEIACDQSLLNGEAKEAKKVAAPEDYAPAEGRAEFLSEHDVFRGAVVCSGAATMQVSQVGEKSVYGSLAAELQVDVERDTPLKLKLGHLADQISKFGYWGGFAIAMAYLFQHIVIHNNFDMAAIMIYCSNWMTLVHDVVEAVMLAVIIIVMAVPEGLPLMIAIVSAQNMGKMLKDNVLVRKLSGIETAGSLNILFSDKTGTITKGILEVVSFTDGAGHESAKFSGVPEALRRLADTAVRYNTGAVIAEDGSVIGGNMTDRALLAYIQGNDAVPAEVLSAVPFDSKEKYSAAYIGSEGHKLSLIKGAPEKIIDQCTHYYDADGQRQELVRGDNAVTKQITRQASRAIRVLAIAASDEELAGQDALHGNHWTLIGILGIRDDVREEAVEAIEQVHSAGVQVVMITGDRKDTASAIAKEAGILDIPDAIVWTSDELAAKSDDEVKASLTKLRVVSRALPADKSRLVKLAQELNLVAGMTGDGVNDSTALKRADVGFAMGGGTEVAKEASEIVILDDNFQSIEKAILYGRTIFNNIRKFIIFQLTINVAAVLISFVAPLLGMDPPLTITQILWVNLVMDTLAALALGGEPTLQRYMSEKPKKRDEAIVSPYMWTTILMGSLWTFALSLIFLMTDFASSYFRVDVLATEASDHNIYLLTGFFAFFIFTSVFNAFNARTMELDLFDNLGRNKGFLQVMGIIVIVQVVMTYFGGEVMHCHGLNVTEWSFVLLMAVTIVPIDLLKKVLLGSYKK